MPKSSKKSQRRAVAGKPPPAKRDRGYYRWLVEPSIAADQPPSLRVNPKHHFTLLTKAALDQLVLQVNRWYDAKGRS